MFKCHVCGHDVAKAELVSEVFNLEGRRVLVENIPALVCEHCGGSNFFTRDDGAHPPVGSWRGRAPVKTVPMEVYALA